MTQKFAGTLYDAKTATLDLAIASQLKHDSDKYGSWSTTQPWYGCVVYRDNKWYFSCSLKGEVVYSTSDEDIFNLIAKVLEDRGK